MVDRSHWQRESDMSRASVNKNSSVNDHKTRAESLRPKVCKQYWRFPLNSTEILEYKGNLQTLFAVRKWRSRGGKSLVPVLLMTQIVLSCPLLNRIFELIIKNGDNLLRKTIFI